MDYGKVRNLLVWTLPKHDKPIRVNDTLITKDEAKRLIRLLEFAIKE